jgi:single-strand DNA-binding protein
MRTVNKSILVGHIGQDPEIRYTQSGTAVANLSLATTSRKKSQTGEWTETTHWHNLVAFGKMAENIQKYIVKGSKLYVEGELIYQEYESQGVKKKVAKIALNELVMLDSKKDSQRAPNPTEEAAQLDDDSIPF